MKALGCIELFVLSIGRKIATACEMTYKRLLWLSIALLLSVVTTAPSAAENIRLLSGDETMGPSIGTQTSPAIAQGGEGFLAVWQDLRTSPFVGPPFSTEGRGFNIYALRLDASGEPVDPAPFVIAQVFGDQTKPRVAWNGQNWLVAWGGRTRLSGTTRSVPSGSQRLGRYSIALPSRSTTRYTGRTGC